MSELKHAEKRIQELRDTLNYHSKLYYVQDAPEVSDYEYEVQMAVVNRKLNPELETMFLASSEKYTYLSSSIVKEMARYHADLEGCLPREIIDAVNQKVQEKLQERKAD